MTEATDDPFAGTAAHYAHHRPRYPPELLVTLVQQAVQGNPRRLLDLGCGTGELAIPLSAAYDEVTAVDASPEMVRYGRMKADQAGRHNIRWLVTAAEGFTSVEDNFNLITAGAAFHWMDRHQVGRRALRWLRSGGAMAVVGVTSTWNGSEEWQRITVGVIRRWLGEHRRAGSGTFAVSRERHEDVLRAVGFTDVTDIPVLVRRVWTLDDFLGYLYSTSFASHRVLGAKAQGFETDLRAALLAHDASGTYAETLRFHCVIGHKPQP